MRKVALIVCCTSALSYSCGDVIDDVSEDDPATGQSIDSVSVASCSIDAPSPQVTYLPSTETACTKCIIRNRADIIPFYKSNGWRTGTKNRNCIVENWCSVDPVGCGLVRARECTESVNDCNEPLPPNLIARIANTLNDGAEWTAFNKNPKNNFWDPTAPPACVGSQPPSATNCPPPCQTWVSMIWYLSGFKARDTQWFVGTGGASDSWAGVDEFASAIATQRPDLVSTEFVVGGPNIDQFQPSLKVGDVINYFGYRTSPFCGECWKHSVIVTREWRPRTAGDEERPARMASMGEPHGIGIAWDSPGFDYTRVRVIHGPSRRLP